jgi:hypothetical protein
MEKQEIEGIEIKTSWEQITLSEFIPLAEIEANEDLKATPLRRSLERIKILTGLTEDELVDLPGEKFGHLITASKFLDVEPETLFEETATFKIGAVEYGYRKPGALSTGEYISLELGIANALKNKRSMLPEILALLIRPIETTVTAEFGDVTEVEKFNTKTFASRVEFFKANLCVPFFIHALSRITSGANGIKQVAKNFMNTESSTKQGRKSKKK